MNHDIAVVIVDEGFFFDEYVQPITLPKPNIGTVYPHINEGIGVVSGFGRTSNDDTGDEEELHVANIPIWNQTICHNWQDKIGPGERQTDNNFVLVDKAVANTIMQPEIV